MGAKYRHSIVNRLAACLFGVPDRLAYLIAGVDGPVVRDGRRLHPALAMLLGVGARIDTSAVLHDATRRRAEMDRVTGLGMPSRVDVRMVERTVDLDGVERAIRVYRPFGITDAAPAVVYYHGGGWVVGSLVSHDGCCRILAAEARAVVVAVDYRLAPEDPFPAAVDDAIAGYRWVVTHADELGVDRTRVGVMGDSAGGTLATVVAQQLRGVDDVPGPAAQGLVYPATDLHIRSRSAEIFAQGFMLTRDDMEWFRAQYVPDEARWDDPRVSPGLADDLSGLPPALVVTAGFDPLRDEGDAYAAAMADAGVRVVHRCYDDMIHGFFGLGVIPGGLATVEEICRAMGDLLHDGT